MKNRIMQLCFYLLTISIFSGNLFAEEKLLKEAKKEKEVTNYKDLKRYLLPKKHPLHAYLRVLFSNPSMFKSPEHFTQAGFIVKRGHNSLMVGFHPSVKNYLFKKFQNKISQQNQLNNFVKRIKGAEIVRQYIKTHHFQHLQVPRKWLYKLPTFFSHDLREPAYLLIVENMDIYDWNSPDGEAKRLYYNMSKEMLTELCMTLHGVGGCDGYPRNQPFTRSGKIAFVDTEHVGKTKMKNHFVKHIVPALNEELQAYALALWMHLEEEEIARNKQ